MTGRKNGEVLQDDPREKDPFTRAGADPSGERRAGPAWRQAAQNHEQKNATASRACCGSASAGQKSRNYGSVHLAYGLQMT